MLDFLAKTFIISGLFVGAIFWAELGLQEFSGSDKKEEKLFKDDWRFHVLPTKSTTTFGKGISMGFPPRAYKLNEIFTSNEQDRIYRVYKKYPNDSYSDEPILQEIQENLIAQGVNPDDGEIPIKMYPRLSKQFINF